MSMEWSEGVRERERKVWMDEGQSEGKWKGRKRKRRERGDIHVGRMGETQEGKCKKQN